MTAILIGLTAGTFGGLVGLGGGVVMVPILVGVLGVRQQRAHGTSLVALVFTGISGAAAYWGRGAVDLAGAVALAVPAMATARLGAHRAHSLSEWRLKRAFGAFMIFVVALLLLKPLLPEITTGGAVGGWAKIAVLGAVGAVTGFFSGMMGVGGGSLMVPAMVLLVGFPQALAQGTSLLAMVPAGAAGAHKHWQLGNVVKPMLPGLILGIVAGAWLGGRAALWLDESMLRAIFAIVIGYTGLRYVWTKRKESPEVPHPTE